MKSSRGLQSGLGKVSSRLKIIEALMPASSPPSQGGYFCGTHPKGKISDYSDNSRSQTRITIWPILSLKKTYLAFWVR